MDVLFEPRAHKQEFFPEPTTESLNDCLVHSINMCLREPYFTTREQIQKLVNYRGKRHKLEIEEKIGGRSAGGYQLNVFERFAVSGSKALTLQYLTELPYDLDFHKACLEKAYSYISATHDHVLLVLYYQRGGVTWNHSLALIRKQLGDRFYMLILDVNKAY